MPKDLERNQLFYKIERDSIDMIDSREIEQEKETIMENGITEEEIGKKRNLRFVRSLEKKSRGIDGDDKKMNIKSH